MSNTMHIPSWILEYFGKKHILAKIERKKRIENDITAVKSPLIPLPPTHPLCSIPCSSLPPPLPLSQIKESIFLLWYVQQETSHYKARLCRCYDMFRSVIVCHLIQKHAHVHAQSLDGHEIAVDMDRAELYCCVSCVINYRIFVLNLLIVQWGVISSCGLPITENGVVGCELISRKG